MGKTERIPSSGCNVVGSEAPGTSCFRENSVWLEEEEGRKELKKRIIKHWNKLSSEVEDCPLLKMLKTWLDMDLDGVIYGSAFSRTLNKVVSTGPFSSAFSAVPQCFTLEPPRGLLHSTGGFSVLLPLFTVKCSYKPQVRSGSVR